MKRLSELGYIETFRRSTTRDLKVVFVVTSLGILVTIIAALTAISIPKVALKTYIGVLVLAMGIILLLRTRFNFSWKKILGIGILSAFNKGISGGGFGPMTYMPGYTLNLINFRRVLENVKRIVENVKFKIYDLHIRKLLI